MVSENEKKLVLARLQRMPPHVKMAIGNKGAFSGSELIAHVEKGDDVGNKIVEMQLFYLRNIAKRYLQ